MAGKAKPKPGTDQDVAAVMAAIDKDFGAGTLMRLGDTPMTKPDVFSSGSIALDEALGIGGFPYGRIIEIYGPESSGKTSLALHASGNVQRQGKRAAVIDAEHALDPAWAAVLGVDTSDLYVSQPDTGEQALQVAERLVRSGLFGVITIDSVAALVPETELKGEIGDSHVAVVARMMSQGLRMLTGPCSDTGTSIIFINQLREKVGVFFGSSETQPGGKALKFYSSIRLDVRRIQTLKQGDKPVGSRVRVKAVKNKTARPFGVAEFDFIFDVGISRERELLDLAVDRKVVRKSGAFYSYVSGSETTALGQGKDAAQRYLMDCPDLADEIEKQVRAAVGLATPLKGRGAAVEPDRDGLAMEGEAPWEDGSSDT